jgi:histidine phosphotransfer protein HptB
MTVDTKALNQLLEVIGNDNDSLVELMDSFLEDGPELLAGMTTGLESGDTQTLTRSAHTLKSSARDFGLLELSESCLQLEQKGKTGSLDGADNLIAQIQILYQQGEDELRIAVSKLVAQ